MTEEIADINAYRKQLTKRGVVGLQNIGNTCFMNAALQILSNTSLLRDYICYIPKEEDEKDNQVLGVFKDDLEENIKLKMAEEKRKRYNLGEDDEIELLVDDINKNIVCSISYQLRQVLKKMWSEKQVVWNPRNLKEIIGSHNAIFRGFNQNDSQELLSYIIDKVHEETKKEELIVIKKRMLTHELLRFFDTIKRYNTIISTIDIVEEKERLQKESKRYCQTNLKEYALYKYILFLQKYKSRNKSVITDLMTGSLCTEIKCLECGYMSFVFDPYNMLSLAIPDNGTTLDECLQTFVLEEKLTDSNKYKCEQCNKKVDATRKTYIWDTPNYLLIQLKRFINNGRMTMKNSKFINYPMDNFSLDNTQSPFYPRDKKYELYGTIQHVGSLGGGHYYAYAKNSLNNKWYEFNDEHVEHIPDTKIVSRMVNNNSYILAYKRKGLEN